MFAVNNVLERGIAFTLFKISGNIRFDKIGKYADVRYRTIASETCGHLTVGNFGAEFFFNVTHADILTVDERINVCAFTY